MKKESYIKKRHNIRDIVLDSNSEEEIKELYDNIDSSGI